MPDSLVVGPVTGPRIRQIADAARRTPEALRAGVDAAMTMIGERGDDGVWISVAEGAQLDSQLDRLAAHPDPSSLPLYGVPFGVKDSVDVAGWPTTLACPAYGYPAARTAPVVQRLLDAGAVLVGKTNLDQFATGLNGTRTPHTIPRSVFGGDLISGGSSSGSAVAVGLAEIPFAVATDTAGSGRVPAALNGVVGYKPSRGLLSAVGLVPACRSLDCVSVMAGTVDDAALVFALMAAPDANDPWSRPRRSDSRPAEDAAIGLPDFSELSFFGDAAMADAHRGVRDRIAAAWPRVARPPLSPFLDAGELLYAGPWVAERYVEFGDFLAEHADDVHPVVAGIISGGARYTAADVFRAQYRLAELKAITDRSFETMDVLILPTIGTTFTVDEVLADPVNTNTKLGHYTHFGNLLDLCAVSVPAGRTADGRPTAVMVLGAARSDDIVLAVAARIAALLSEGTAASG